MKYDDVRKILGTQIQIAEALGMEQPTISQWKKYGIPLERQWQIQLLTGGRLQAESLKKSRAKVTRKVVAGGTVAS